MSKFCARFILCIHLGITAFVVFTPFYFLYAKLHQLTWQPLSWLQYLHFATTVFIAWEVINNKPCPLMTWENHFRKKALLPLYTTGFFDYWHEKLFAKPLEKWLFNGVFLAVFVASVLAFL